MSIDQRKYPANLIGLLKFCTENTKAEDATGASFEPMSEQRKNWLKEAFEAMAGNDPVKKMIEDIKILVQTNLDDQQEFQKSNQDNITQTQVISNQEVKNSKQIKIDIYKSKEVALEDLIGYCEEIDLANDFQKIGGLEILPQLLSEDSQPIIRSLSCELIATLSQNNPYCQSKILEAGLLRLLLSKLDDPKENDLVKIKLLYAISCIIRESPEAQGEFIKDGGMEIILSTIPSQNEKLQIKSAFLIASLSREADKYKDMLFNLGIVPVLIEQIKRKTHLSAQEHLITALSSIVESHSAYLAEIGKEKYGLREFLLQLKKDVNGSEEDHEYISTLLKLFI